MVKKALILLVLASLLVTVFLCTSCGGKGGSSADNGDEAAEDSKLVDMLKRVPRETDVFFYYDIGAFVSDPDWNEYYYDSGFLNALQNTVPVAGINVNDVEAMVCARRDREDSISDSFMEWLISGQFDLQVVRDELAENGYTSSQYNGVELWSLHYEYNDEDIGRSVAFWPGLIVFSYLDTPAHYVDVVNGQRAPLYGDTDLADVMAKLKPGLLFTLARADESVAPYYEGMTMSGSSFYKKDASTCVLTMVFKFDTDTNAEAAMDDIKAYLEAPPFGYHDVQVSREITCVMATADVDVASAFPQDSA